MNHNISRFFSSQIKPSIIFILGGPASGKGT